MAEERKSIASFASQLREEFDIPADMSDSELVSRYVKKHPEALGQIETATPRKPVGRVMERFKEGMTAMPREAIEQFKQGPLPGGGRAQTEPGLMGALKDAMDIFTGTFSGLKKTAQHPGSLVDMPGIEKAQARGDVSGAAGRSLTQGLLAGLMVKGMLPKEAPEASAAAAFKTATEIISAPIKAQLDTHIGQIEAGMKGQMTNVQAMRAGMQKAVKQLERMESAPGTKGTDFTAAKNAVQELVDWSKQGMLPWSDLRAAVKKINESMKGIKDPTTKGTMKAALEPAKAELDAVAEKAGMGDAWKNWKKDYAELSQWERDYQQVLKQKTTQQLATKATAKTAPSLRVLGTTPVRFGRTRMGAIAEHNRALINQAHSALEEIGGRIKERKIEPPVPQPSGTVPGAKPTDINEMMKQGIKPPDVTAGAGAGGRSVPQQPGLTPIAKPTGAAATGQGASMFGQTPPQTILGTRPMGVQVVPSTQRIFDELKRFEQAPNVNPIKP